MKRVFLAAILPLLWCGFARAEEPVYFADVTLKTAVEDALWIWDPMPVDMLDLTRLTHIRTFDTQGDGIQDLTGLEYASNLQMLNLRLNRIGDLAPLAGLANLETIDLSQNIIRDVSPLAGLNALKYLNLHGNLISDLSPLAQLGSLQTLILRINRIADISPLAGLTSLEYIDFYCNKISDLSALAGLHNLRRLTLRQNKVRDVSPLSGLANLQELDLQLNHIGALPPLAGLSNLQYLDLNENKITDIAGLLGVTSLKRLDLRDNELDRDAYDHYLQIIAEDNPQIDLRYTPHHEAPTNVAAVKSQDHVRITWDEVNYGPSYVSYYRVYRAASSDDVRTPISEWQISAIFDDTTVEPEVSYTYWVQAATSSRGDNASEFSDAAGTSLPHPTVLAVSSTTGGSVIAPGEGTFATSPGRIIRVEAVPADSSLYFFSGWTGTAVDAGKISNAGQSSTFVVVDGQYTLEAHFTAYLDTLYVDNDARDDPHRDGTREHPLDKIQEAINVADHGATVVVRSGTYQENINLLGKSIQLNGIDPNGVPYPVIDGGGTGPVVSFTSGEDPNCALLGFVITSGRGEKAGAIACLRSSPTIANCVIVGNRATRPYGAAVYCMESNAVFNNCTIIDNVGGEQGAAMTLIDSPIVLTNSIVWGNTPGEMAVAGVSVPSITYANIARGEADQGNINVDPLFARRGYWADPANLSRVMAPSDSYAVWMGGDYHLKSQAGRWTSGSSGPLGEVDHAWVQDSITSPCIDAGDPTGPVGPEPTPNGNLVNMGAYGGTTQASRSY